MNTGEGSTDEERKRMPKLVEWWKSGEDLQACEYQPGVRTDVQKRKECRKVIFWGKTSGTQFGGSSSGSASPGRTTQREGEKKGVSKTPKKKRFRKRGQPCRTPLSFENKEGDDHKYRRMTEALRGAYIPQVVSHYPLWYRRLP